MTQNANGDKYFRLEGCSQLVNFAGFKEAAEAFYEQNAGQKSPMQFVSEIVQNILSLKAKTGKKHEFSRETEEGEDFIKYMVNRTIIS